MRAMLRYRYLFTQMVQRELRQKYKGSALGVLWYIVNPLALMGAYWLMFGELIPVVNEPDYPLFLMVALSVWLFFAQSLTGAADSLIAQSSLVSKVRFPRETIPASVVTVQLATSGVLLAILAPIVIAIRGTLKPALLLLPLIVLCLYAFVLGAALLVSVLNAYFRDVAPILGAVLLPWFFLTPIFFRVERLPGIGGNEWARWLLTWGNPVAPFVNAARDVLYAGVAPGWKTLVYIAAAGAIALAGGLALFRRMEGELAVVL